MAEAQLEAEMMDSDPGVGPSLSGVIDDGQLAVEGAEVIITEVNGDQNEYTEITDQNGEYMFTPSAGTYEVVVYSGDAYISGYFLPFAIDVSSEEVLDITLDKVTEPQTAPIVSGTVNGPDGTTPIAAVEVMIIVDNYFWSGMTDGNGDYSIVLQPGTVDGIMAFAPDELELSEYSDGTFNQVDVDTTYDITFVGGGGGQPEWALDLTVDLDGYNSILNFGVEEGASPGFDQGIDIVAPPSQGGLENYFYHPNNPTSPEDLTMLTASLIGFGEFPEWDMVVDIPVELTGLVEVGWDNTQFDLWPSSVSVTLDTPDGDVDMRTLDTYTWTSSGDEIVTLTITVAEVL